MNQIVPWQALCKVIEPHYPKAGNGRPPIGLEWYFGMKLHIGVDSRTGLAHSAVVSAANMYDKHPLPHLLHGNERRMYGDSAYAAQKALINAKAPRAKEFTNQRTRKGGQIDEIERAKIRAPSRMRSAPLPPSRPSATLKRWRWRNEQSQPSHRQGRLAIETRGATQDRDSGRHSLFR
jgi:IS5 family transposase